MWDRRAVPEGVGEPGEGVGEAPAGLGEQPEALPRQQAPALLHQVGRAVSLYLCHHDACCITMAVIMMRLYPMMAAIMMRMRAAVS